MKTKSHAYRITIRAVLTALIIVQTMIPFLGYIPLGITSITIIHITVIVAAIVLGPKDGMFIGLIWGIFTIIRAFSSPTTPLDTLVFTNPIVSIVPRVLVGLVAGLTFHWLYKKSKNMFLASSIAAILGTITNTVLVLFFMGTLYTGLVAETYQVSTSGLFTVLAGIAVTNGVSEVLSGLILTPILVKALFTATRLTPPS